MSVSGPRRIVVGMVLILLLGACRPEEQSLRTVTVAPPVVDSVRILPGTIHAAPGTVFSLTAVAKGYLGVPVTVPQSGKLGIEWSASASVFQDPHMNPVVITTPPNGSFTLEARVTPLAGTGGPSVTSNVVTVHVTPGAGTALTTTGADDSDWIEVEHIPGSAPAAVLVQASEGSTHLLDWAFGVVGSARLGRNLDAGSSSQGELAVFARDRAMELWPPGGPPACGADPPTCPWTPTADHLVASPMEPTSARGLPLRAAVVDLSEQVAGLPIEAWVEGQAKQAFQRLNALRVGLDLEWSAAFEHVHRDPETGAPAPVENPDVFCENIDNHFGPSDSVKDPLPMLYVVFVPEILVPSPTGAGWTRRTGYTCTPDPAWVSRVVLIGSLDYNITTLVHELGHVLSLNKSYLDGAGGHTNGRVGFEIGNIMHNTDALPYRASRNHLTLGQIYRMNAHPGSWLNTFLPDSLQKLRDCPTDIGHGVCPAMAADLGG